MGHIILLFIQNEQIHENGIFTISSGYQILYYDNNILQNEENNLSNNNNTNNNDNWKCALLGIPIEMSNEELLSFLEPYLTDITNIILFHDIYLEGCNTAIIQFIEKNPMISFCRLYSNLHFPSHSTAAPCIVFKLQECIISFDRSTTPSMINATESDLTFLPSSPPTLSSLTSLTSLPSVERTISNELQNFDHSNRENDRLAWSNILSPPPPNYLQLPNCPICLRRIINRISHIDDDTNERDKDKLIIGPAFIGHGDRCIVCHIFSDSTSQLRKCNVCGLRENLWTCLQCGYTGCGRYTSQHAKKHFHQKGHPFSLELATGRIWDYIHDTFVHIDPLSEFSPQTISSLTTTTTSTTTVPSSISQETSFEGPSVDKPYSICPLSSSTNTIFPLYPQDEQSIHKSSKLENSNLFSSSLSEATSGKLRHLQKEYEDLLLSQLSDQQLHYEKLLAREAVGILESGQISSLDRLNIPNGMFDPFQWAEHTDQELATIEQIKLDISGLEYEYSMILQKIRLAEMNALELRKINEKLVANQKIYRQRIADYTERAKDLKKISEEKIENLEQQINDLQFYLRARDQISSSGLSDEAKSGVMVVQQSTESNTSRTSKYHRKKKGGR